jgi:uncharacterized membrane protein
MKQEYRSVIWNLSAVLVFVFALNLSAHTGHKKKPEPQSSPSTQTSSGATETQPMEQLPLATEPVPELERDEQTIMKEAIASHLHNKIVHFPLALGLAGAILILLGHKWPQYLPAARLLLVIAALCGVAAYFTGRAQEEPFEEGEMKPFLEWHRTLGITTGVVLWIGVLLTSFSQYKKLLLFYAIVLLILISATGFLGGILAHG